MNKKFLITAVVAGFFLTLFTGWIIVDDSIMEGIESGYPFPWITTNYLSMEVDYDVFNFVYSMIVWTVISFGLLFVFKRYKIPF